MVHNDITRLKFISTTGATPALDMQIQIQTWIAAQSQLHFVIVSINITSYYDQLTNSAVFTCIILFTTIVEIKLYQEKTKQNQFN